MLMFVLNMCFYCCVLIDLHQLCKHCWPNQFAGLLVCFCLCVAVCVMWNSRCMLHYVCSAAAGLRPLCARAERTTATARVPLAGTCGLTWYCVCVC